MLTRTMLTLASAALALPTTAQQLEAEAEAEVAVETETETESEAAAGETVLAEPADIIVGAEVRDPDGGLVGTIESVDAQGAVVATGNARAKLPIGSFGKNGRGLVISLSRAELEAAARAESGG